MRIRVAIVVGFPFRGDEKHCDDEKSEGKYLVWALQYENLLGPEKLNQGINLRTMARTAPPPFEI